MRSVHVLGLGLLVGMTALGAMLATVAYRWQEANFPRDQGAGAQTAQTPGAAAGPAGSQEVAQGRALFQQRCTTCHTIGSGKKVGPDLKGATDRRTHDWLVGFITHPDQVIASNDPIATQLLQEYGVPMPNTNTSEAEASNIIAHIQAESGGAVAAAKPSGGTPGAQTKPSGGTPEAPTKPGAAPAPGAAAGGNAPAGQAVFQQNCSGCHPGGNQGAGPALKGRNLGADLVTTTVRQGRGAMPPFSAGQINDQQLANLAAYVQSLK